MHPYDPPRRPHLYVVAKGEEFLPSYAHPHDAGLDLRLEEAVSLEPGEIKIVKTGLRVQIPQGYVGFLNPRSGLSTRGVTINNAPGTVDAGYQGDLAVILINHSDKVVSFERLQRIAQLVVLPVVQPLLIPVSRFPEETLRGDSGFGSTGLN